MSDIEVRALAVQEGEAERLNDPLTSNDELAEVVAEQQNIAEVDTRIQQAAEALRTSRESVARSFFAQNKSEVRKNPGSDPRGIS